MRIRVVTTMHTEEGDWVRRRRCLACSHRWYTLQSPEVVVEKERLKLPRWWIGAKLVRLAVVDGSTAAGSAAAGGRAPYTGGTAKTSDARKRTG